LPDISSAISARNNRKGLGGRRLRKARNPIGKPPLALNSNAKISMYPDASNYKAGTASNKILELRDHLKKR